MPGISVTITGLDRFLARLAAAPMVAEIATAGALYRVANRIFAESQREVPVDTGTLRASGHVTLPEQRGAELAVTIGYGGAAQAYAFIVHERLDAFHAPPTKAKYLEDPVNRERDRFREDMGAELRVALGGAFRGG